MGGIKREVKIITSARPSARPSFFPLVFLGLVHFFFSETLYGVRVPYGDVHDRAQFLWKNPLPAKLTNNGQKMTQKWVFWTF